jgi:hypothetical protein
MALHPDFSGRLWFISYLGVVGALDMDTGVVLGTVNLAPETMSNGIVSDETGGVFFNTDRAMYRFDLGQDGKPVQTWREAYDYGTHVKVYSFGSGTTPSLMGTDLVNMTDNADPQMHVNVYRRAKGVEGDRLICSVPVFMPGQSATEDSLISTDQSMVVQNNYGYALPRDVDNGRTTKPGFVRIDIDEDRNGCHIVWTNMEVSEPIVTPVLSLATGLIYAYTKPKGPANTDAWYFTAIDFQTGEVVYQVLAGTGGLYNAHCTIFTLGPDGAAYLGVWGGIVKLKDGP